MANLIKNFLGYLKIDGDDDFDDFLNEDEEEVTSVRKNRKKEAAEDQAEEKAERPVKNTVSESFSAPVRKEVPKAAKTERTTSNKIVPIRTTPKGLEVCIMKPSSFEDSQDICDMLLTGRAVVVNLEGFDPMDAQRIMDFISGAVYAINGKLHQISKFIFIFSPDTIDISGDYLGFIADDSFEVPTINKDF